MDRYDGRLQNRDGSEDAIDLGVLAGEAEAILAARSALLVSLTARRIQIWRAGVLISTLDRQVAQFRSRTAPPGAAWRCAAE